MTTFNLYCDESRHTSDPKDRYAVIGALKCPRDKKKLIVGRIHALMAKHRAHGEAGWKRLSPNRIDFYFALLELFVNDSDLSFRCILVDRPKLDHDKYNNGDSELGFYKLYYQMLVHWLQPGEEYYIYLDWQQNKTNNRFDDVRTNLIHKLNGRAKIAALEPITSDTQPLMQLSDLLIGAVGYEWNGYSGLPHSSTTKVLFCKQLASQLNLQSIAAGTPKESKKFNIFDWQARSDG